MKISTIYQKFLGVIALLLFTTQVAWAAWTSGQAVSNSGDTYYVAYQDSYEDLNTIETGPTITLSGPGAKLIYTARGSSSLTGAGVKYFNYSYSTNGGSSWTDKSQNLTTSNAQYTANLSTDVNAIRFLTKTGSTYTKYVSNIRVEMAKYINNPSATSLSFGSAELGTLLQLVLLIHDHGIHFHLFQFFRMFSFKI